MARRQHSVIVLGIVTLTMLACQSPPGPTAGIRPGAPIVAQAAHMSSLTVVIDGAASASRYGLRYVRQADWRRARATLSNADAAIPTLTLLVDARVDPATGGRSAAFSFAPVKPASGYTLKIELIRPDAAGADQIVAEGQNAGFTIAAGANNVAVGFGFTAQGDLVVTVPAPTIVANAVTTTADTFSQVGIVRHAGSTAGGSADGTSPLTAGVDGVAGFDIGPGGTLYMADSLNHRLRALPPQGAAYLVAGGTTSGFSGDGGPADAALLSSPTCVAVDQRSGDLLFTDMGNGRIRRIVNGTITTFAGGGSDMADTVADQLAAGFAEPEAIAVDGARNVFVFERGTGRLRRIAANGGVTTLVSLGAGQWSPLAIDRARGQLWVTNSTGTVIHVVNDIGGATPALDTSPVFTVPAGTGTPRVLALAHDQSQTLYAFTGSAGGGGVPSGGADGYLWRIPLQADGHIPAGRSAEIVAGSGAGSITHTDYDISATGVANARTAMLATGTRYGLAIDLADAPDATKVAGHLFLSVVHPAGGPPPWTEIARLYPAPIDAEPTAPPTPTPPPPPAVSALEPTAGSVGQRVIITGTDFSPIAAQNVVRFAGEAATVEAASATSLEVVVPENAITGAVEVTTNGQASATSPTFTVQPSGTLIDTITVGTGPAGLAFDAAGNAWVANNGSHDLTRIAPDGTVTGTFALGGGTAPLGITIAPSGQIYVVQNGTNELRRLAADGTILGTFGDLGTGRQQWVAAAANSDPYVVKSNSKVIRFDAASTGGEKTGSKWAIGGRHEGVRIDGAGNVWFTSGSDKLVYQMSPDGLVLAKHAVGNDPQDLAIGPSGEVWVANKTDATVTKVAAGAVVGTFASGSLGFASAPEGIAVDAAGNVWVVNSGSSVVSKLSPAGAVLGDFVVGVGPRRVAIDGAGRIWVTNATSGSVSRLTP